MNKPVLSLDVSKGSSYAATYLSYNEPLDKPFYVSHTPQGLIELLQKLKNLEQRSGVRPDVILEATGNYSKPISFHLGNAGYSVIVLNPLQTHNQKKSSIRKVKTDPVDAKRIAELYYLHSFNPQSAPIPSVAELKNLTRQYHGLSTLHIETQLRFISLLDLAFPGFTKVFSNPVSSTALQVISTFISPEKVLSSSDDDLLRCIKGSRKSEAWSKSKCERLKAVAKASLPYGMAQHSNEQVLKEYVKLLQTQIEILADLRAHITATAKDIPAYSLLLSIPGVGPATGAVILAEIQDAQRFTTAKQLTAYAGLDASVFESGRFKSNKNKISKRGSSHLRKALYQSTVVAVCKRKSGPVNPILYDFYSKKVNEGKPKRVALIATCNKLLRVIYGIWRKSEPFKLS